MPPPRRSITNSKADLNLLSSSSPKPSATSFKPQNSTIPITSPRTNSARLQTNNAASPIPAPKLHSVAVGSAAGRSSEYDIIQEDEINSLQAIYDTDFRVLEAVGAWSKTLYRSFELTIRASTNPDTFVTLSVKLPSTYPKTTPLIEITNYKKVRQAERLRIAKIVTLRPKDFIGSAMIYSLAWEVQEVLHEAADEYGTEIETLSFAQQREEHEAFARQQALLREQEAMRQKEAESAEKEKQIMQMVDQELAGKKAPRRHKSDHGALHPELGGGSHGVSAAFSSLSLERPIILDRYTFSRISFPMHWRQGPLSTVLMVQPVVPLPDISKTDSFAQMTLDNAILPVLPKVMIKRVTIKGTSDSTKLGVQDIELLLSSLRKMRKHENVMGVLDYTIAHRPENSLWIISVFNEYGDNGSLGQILQNSSALPVDRIRAWTLELLDALHFYHRHRVVHGRIHPHNVLFKTSPHAPLVVKLADGAFQNKLYQLHNHDLAAPDRVDPSFRIWTPPELGAKEKGSTIPASSSSNTTTKTDIWDLGVVFIQMMFGLSTPDEYSSVTLLEEGNHASHALKDLLRKFFHPDPNKRSSAFDLLVANFLRTNLPAKAPHSGSSSKGKHHDGVEHVSSHSTRVKTHSRHRSPNRDDRRGEGDNSEKSFSRYANDWIEVGKLGKGGYGEVIKVRNKVDNGIYAIKKIKGSSSVTSDVLSEVYVLAQLNHVNVVRYYSAWIENVKRPDIGNRLGAKPKSSSSTETSTEYDSTGEDENENKTEDNSDSGNVAEDLEFGGLSSGLDFISTSYPTRKSKDSFVVFGRSSDEESGTENSDESSDDSDESSASTSDSNSDLSERLPATTLSTSRSTATAPPSRPTKTVLYIQMEYCEHNTLRHLIQSSYFEKAETRWSMLRRILEGLAYIHSHGIIHRDLKPDNIFIDSLHNPKIGDFGLATPSQFQLMSDKSSEGGSSVLPHECDDDVTKSIGTALYAAPEMGSNVTGSYNDKIDIYSLGIMFFEMCYPLRTGMERESVLRKLREAARRVPSDFPRELSVELELIESLVSHVPDERPSCEEILTSGKIPVDTQFKSMDDVVNYISDQTSFQRFISLWIKKQMNRGKLSGFTWDLESDGKPLAAPPAASMILSGYVKESLMAIFKRHCAVEIQRQLMFPPSDFYKNNHSVVRMMDDSGNYLQLPYDLTLPYARILAKQDPSVTRTYTFGQVYRKAVAGGHHQVNGETDFDIVSLSPQYLELCDAEVLRVMDEIIEEFPCFVKTNMSFHLNHTDLLNLVMEFCRVDSVHVSSVKECLSKLNFRNWSWQRIRMQLRSSKFDIPTTVLENIAQFNFQDPPEVAFDKLIKLFQKSRLSYVARLTPIITYFRTVIKSMEMLGVKRQVLICPLSSFHEAYYDGGLMFQCVNRKARDIIAAGGRYDKLIEQHRPIVKSYFTGCHAVGVNIASDKIAAMMLEHVKDSDRPVTSKSLLERGRSMDKQQATRRGDVVIASYDEDVLATTGAKLVSELWSAGFSAQLSFDCHTMDDLETKYAPYMFTWLVIIADDIPGTGKAYLDVRSRLGRGGVVDQLCSSDLVWHLRIQKGEHSDGTLEWAAKRRRRVRVLDSLTGRLVSGKRHLIEIVLSHVDAFINLKYPTPGSATSGSLGNQSHNAGSIDQASSVIATQKALAASAHLLAVGGDDDSILNRMATTRMSDPESWKQVAASVLAHERGFWKELSDLLTKWRNAWIQAGGKDSGGWLGNSIGPDSFSGERGGGGDRGVSDDRKGSGGTSSGTGLSATTTSGAGLLSPNSAMTTIPGRDIPGITSPLGGISMGLLSGGGGSGSGGVKSGHGAATAGSSSGGLSAGPDGARAINISGPNGSVGGAGGSGAMVVGSPGAIMSGFGMMGPVSGLGQAGREDEPITNVVLVCNWKTGSVMWYDLAV